MEKLRAGAGTSLSSWWGAFGRPRPPELKDLIDTRRQCCHMEDMQIVCRFIESHFGRTTVENFQKKLAAHQFFF